MSDVWSSALDISVRSVSMSREAADVAVGECMECAHLYPRLLPVRDGLLMNHGRPIPEERRGRGDLSIEACPGSGQPPL